MATQEVTDKPTSALTSKEQAEPKRSANLISLIALGVGAVISGDFFGWNFGLERAGFGGLIISTLLVGLMYVCVSLSLAELAGMYPSAEGAFRFSRHALGPYAGFCCGLSESLEYVLLVPVIITGLGDQLNVLFGITVAEAQIGWWVFLCIFYAGLHLSGAKTTFLSNVVITGCSLLTLFIYWCVCLSMVSGTDNDVLNDRIYNIPPDPEFSDSTKFLPKGGYGIFTSLVFAAWFFIAVEELPLAGEDAKNPKRDIPRALIGSIAILMTTAFLTAFFSVSVPGGSYNISSTGAPLARALIAGLMDNCVNLNDPTHEDAANICNASPLKCEYNEDEGTCWDTELSKTALAWEIVINLGTLIGLANSCHAIIYAGGRQLMSLTRNGIFPPFTKFDVVSKKDNNTPWVALLVDIVLSFLVSLIVFLIGEGVDFLVGLSVAAACVSYILSMVSYIVLKRSKPDTDEFQRPYKSPLGVVGAGYAAIMSLLVGISFFVDIGVGLGAVITSVVVVVFVLIYGLLSVDYMYGCCGKESGKTRFERYEQETQYLDTGVGSPQLQKEIEVRAQSPVGEEEDGDGNEDENTTEEQQLND